MKTLIALIAAATLAAPSTFAEDKEQVSVTIEYDAAELANPATAERAFADIRRQAAEACTVKYGLNVMGTYVDQDCVSEVLDQVAVSANSQQFAELRAEKERASR